MRVMFLLLLLIVSASAKEFPVSDQEQNNILLICDYAAQSPSISRDVRANIAAFCIAWQKKMEQPVEPPKEK